MQVLLQNNHPFNPEIYVDSFRDCLIFAANMNYKISFFIIFFVFSRLNAQQPDDLQIAKVTASVTLWYPKAKIEKSGLMNTTILMQKKGEENWVIIKAWEKPNHFTGYYLDDKYNPTNTECKIDSADVSDWLYIENNRAFGAFVLRETNWKTFKKIAKTYHSKPYKWLVSTDFITESKLKTTLKEDSMADYILRTRYPGGIEGFYTFAGSHIQYPEYARMRGLEGYTYVAFEVLPSGNIENIKIIRSIGGATQESALNMYKKMPVWKRSDTDETIKLILPVAFKLL